MNKTGPYPSCSDCPHHHDAIEYCHKTRIYDTRQHNTNGNRADPLNTPHVVTVCCGNHDNCASPTRACKHRTASRPNCVLQEGCVSPQACDIHGECYYEKRVRQYQADCYGVSFDVDPKTQPANPKAGDGGGLRYNSDKPEYEQIPPEALEALAWHYTQSGGPRGGPTKYPARNWERGMAMLKCFGCLMRHSWKWMRGEDSDPETGSHHMIAVAWNAFAIYTYTVRGIGVDDRPLKSGARQ